SNPVETTLPLSRPAVCLVHDGPAGETPAAGLEAAVGDELDRCCLRRGREGGEGDPHTTRARKRFMGESRCAARCGGREGGARGTPPPAQAIVITSGTPVKMFDALSCKKPTAFGSQLKAAIRSRPG